MPGPFCTSSPPKSPDSPAAKRKDAEGNDPLTKQLRECSYVKPWQSQFIPPVSHTQSWCQLTRKSLHSRNSKEGLASDKAHEEKFIDLFIQRVLPRWSAGTNVSMAQVSSGRPETLAGREETVGLAPLPAHS